jgi:Fe-Mn family superoxide dismutase
VLPYSLEEGLAPAISSMQLDFHYNKHHMTYVTKLNELISGTKYEDMALSDIITDTAGVKEKKKIFNNAAQHFNHSFFWKCMKPGGSEIPKHLQSNLEKHFGSIDKFKEQVIIIQLN